jgi:hypothetical protein
VFCCVAAKGQSVSLQWTASTNRATAGYILYWGTATNSLSSQINVGTNTVVTLYGLTAGQMYYFAVGGYDASGMDGPLSNEASFAAPTNSAQSAQATSMNMIVCPASGPVGTVVSVYATNLSTTSGVTFNGLSAPFTIISNTVLTTTVPAGATTGPLAVTTTGAKVASQFNVTASSSPANDDFALARVLTGTAAFAWANTAGATKEAGEPNHGGNSGGASVWYRWVAPSSGWFTLDTGGSQFDTLLAVYTGAKVSQLTVVASNTAPADGPLSFEAAEGVAYQIAVDGFNGVSGDMQLRLSQVFNGTNIFSDTFETTEGVVSGSPLAGQNGWVSSVPKLSGVAANYFPGDGQQGYIGVTSLALTNNTVLLYHPLNYTVQTNTLPIIQFSVLLQIYNPLNEYHDSFGWAFRNANEQQLFNLMFNNTNNQITFSLDDGMGQRSTGFDFNTTSSYQLVITADLSRNQWSATLNGTTIVTREEITTVEAPLTLGDIDAEGIYAGLLSGMDGMVFDNYTVSAQPESLPSIEVGLQDENVTAGNNLVLGVVAGGAGPLAYQWLYDGAIIPGATNATLWLSNCVPEQSGSYLVTIANAAGSATADCTVTISYPETKALLASPVSMGISGQLLNFNVTTGSSYRVQASTNLTTWTTLGGFYASGSTATFLDSASASFPRRFYRLISP